MKWTRGGRSGDIEDRRGQGGGGGGGVGNLLGMLPLGRMGIGGIILVAVLALVASRAGLFDGGGTATPRTAPAADDEMTQFVSFVLDDAQATWEKKLGGQYRHAKLVLFDGQTPTSCGYGSAAMGPFYCPGDEKVYIDLAFFRELDRRFGAPGDFAQAYVLAHEIGHHVQKLLGVEQQMRREAEARPDQANELSVRLELMADCLAGVWGASTRERNVLEPGDVEEGLRAAAAVGDDTLQKQAGGRVSPESWTHGSAEMRARWLRRGLERGEIKACDTFSSREL